MYNNAIKSQLQKIDASESNPHGFRRVGPQTVGGSASADFDRFWPVWAVFASFECRSWAAQRASPKGGASASKAPAAASKGAIEFAIPEGCSRSRRGPGPLNASRRCGMSLDAMGNAKWRRGSPPNYPRRYLPLNTNYNDQIKCPTRYPTFRFRCASICVGSKYARN